MSDAEKVRKALRDSLLTAEFNEHVRSRYVAAGEEDQYTPLAEVYRSKKWAPQAFPSGEIDLATGRKERPEEYGTNIIYEVNLFWHVTGNEEERLDDELSRLVSSTHDYFEGKPNLLPFLPGPVVWTGNEDYSPLTPNVDTQGYIKSAWVQIFVRVIH